MTVLSSLCPVCPLICKGFFQTYSSKYVLLGPGWNVSGLCTLQVPILNLSSSLTPLYRGTPQFCLWFLLWLLDLDLDFQIFNLATVTKLKLATHPFMHAQLLSHVWLFATPWIVAHQAALCPWDFSRQEYWTGFPFPSPGDLPNPGTHLLQLLHWQLDSLPLHHLERPIHLPTEKQSQLSDPRM